MAEAIAAADEDGLAALSMKTLATRLGAGTMSLYRYVPAKEDLVSLMFDTALGSPPDLAGQPWREALTTWAHANRDYFHRHPWALTIVAQPRAIGPHELAWTEAALRVLTAAGVPERLRFDVLFTINGYARGAAQFSAPGDRGPTLDVAAVLASGREAEFATMLSLAAAMPADYDLGSTATFEFGLGIVLDGIARLM
ncbi:MAG: TetR family transcriptional regulator [Hamadaea sp.]|nr:TetR family transcriptional regulator [Hamadaea sp.]